MNYKVHVYDPVEEAVVNTKQIFQNNIIYHDSAEECVKSSKLCVLINSSKDYSKLLSWMGDDNILIDCWRFFKIKSKKIIHIGIK